MEGSYVSTWNGEDWRKLRGLKKGPNWKLTDVPLAIVLTLFLSLLILNTKTLSFLTMHPPPKVLFRFNMPLHTRVLLVSNLTSSGNMTCMLESILVSTENVNVNV